MPVTKKAPAPRVLWKGAISFGLVHIPVALYSATVDHGIDFDWLDKRTMDPVGYKRVNKKTGKEIAREQIVKGIEYESGEYVVLSDKEIAAAYPKTTQTIEIESFVPANGIPFVYLERPYYVAPINRGAKVYALLRETLQRTGRVGVARVVIQTKQHLAALVPVGPGLVLNLLRWGADIRPWSDLPLPSEDVKKAGLREREIEMAKELVEDMSADWDPEAFRDEFKDEILRLVDKKVKAGQTETVIRPDPEEGEAQDTGRGAKVIDLTELLKRSLRKGGAGGGGRARNADAEEEDEEEEEEPEAPRTRRPAAKKRKTAARSSSGSSGSTARSASARQRRAA
ncbi:non-homologous end joining protein Ku [Variovorax atrisoli]|uniref:non-homologous end joining protein Ku n=1 Tax=Variovorax atrisoli TaxID=3394203 RepID=UPI00160AE427|nr:Ku protein [Variovorax sp. BK613]MBB3640021.1 DNA end-binding protein Ku [Variovorax sp. BK613]